MCTVFYLRHLGLLSKNRDKENPEHEEVVATSGVLAMRTVGADYFSLGINRYGIAFVSTAVNNPAWTRAVEEGRSEEAGELWRGDTTGRSSPSHLVSELLPSARSVEEIAQAIRDADTMWRGYNVILAGPNGGLHLEVHGREIHSRLMDERDAITNHFRTLPHGPRAQQDYPSSFGRLDYAREKIAGIQSREDLFAAIHPPALADRARIWRKGTFQTISSTVISLTDSCLFTLSDQTEAFVRHDIV